MNYNTEAICVIGIFTLLLGVLLLVPGMLWAKYLKRKDSNGNLNLRVTRFGLVYIAFFIVILFTGIFSPFFVPDAFISKLVSTHLGRIMFALVLGLVSFPIERLLKSKGIILFERRGQKKA